MEDIGLFLRLVDSVHDVRVLPDRLVRYRMRADSASRDPSTVDDFERNQEQIYIAAAQRAADPTTCARLLRRLRGLRDEQALRRARWAFQNDDIETAREATREADPATVGDRGRASGRCCAPRGEGLGGGAGLHPGRVDRADAGACPAAAPG